MRKQNQDLRIRRPANPAASAAPLLPLLCGSTVAALAGLTGMEEPWLPALMGAAVCLLELVMGKRKWFHTGVLALLVLSLLLLRRPFIDGFCQWYNSMGAVYTAETGMVLPPLEATADAGRRILFACWAGAAAGVGLSFLVGWGREALCITVMLLCLGVSAAIGRMIDPLPLVLAAAMLCAGGGWKHKVLPLGILAAFVLLTFLPGVDRWAGAQRDAVLRKLHVWRYETNYTTLPEGRLEPLSESDAPALVVTMEKPEVLYLRGFTGAQLENDRWMPLDPQLLGENQELLYWLNSREFDLRAQFEAAASVLGTEKNTITIQNVGACSAYRYIPFTLRADGQLPSENLTDTAEGARYDSFTTIYGGAAVLPELLTALEAADGRYLQAEAAYREFVKAHYLDVPGDLAEKLQPYWEKAEGMDAQSAVKMVLQSCYPDGAAKDPGYATAAVLTLRHFGIPARYAEGYILPETTQTTLELTGAHAACWAEVYHDGIGWIPMALTPGLDGNTEQQEDQSLPPDTPEETLPPETEPQTQPEPDGGSQVRISRVLYHGALLLGPLMVMLAAALILRRKYILNQRQAILWQEDVREAIIWSFADSISVLERLQIQRGRGSLDALTPLLAERFGTVFSERFEAASRLHARALFSSHPMTEADRRLVHSFRASALDLLRSNANKLHRFWMRYILCLF